MEEQNLQKIESSYDAIFEDKKDLLLNHSTEIESIQKLQVAQDSVRAAYKSELHRIDPDFEQKDSDYIFLTFILGFLPPGLIGLLLAVIFSAAMSSTAGELNALAATTTVDYYKKFWSKDDNDKRDLRASKLLTVGWGILAIVIALTAGLFENLIQLVNILGSLFYGTILGVFLLALLPAGLILLFRDLISKVLFDSQIELPFTLMLSYIGASFVRILQVVIVQVYLGQKKLFLPCASEILFVLTLLILGYSSNTSIHTNFLLASCIGALVMLFGYVKRSD